MTTDSTTLARMTLRLLHARYPGQHVAIDEATVQVWADAVGRHHAVDVSTAVERWDGPRFPSLNEFVMAVQAAARTRVATEHQVERDQRRTLPDPGEEVSAHDQGMWMAASMAAFKDHAGVTVPERTAEILQAWGEPVPGWLARLVAGDTEVPAARESACRGCDGSGFVYADDERGGQSVRPCEVCRFGPWLRWSEGHTEPDHYCDLCKSPKVWHDHVAQRREEMIDRVASGHGG